MATQRIKNKDGEWVLVNNGGGGSTSDIIVDSELSSESTNPIQNKAVTESLKNRPELLEIRYYFGEKELTEEDKAINAASINTYVTNGQKNLYKFFIQNEFHCILESTTHFEDVDENGDPFLMILFDDLYAITAVFDGKKTLPFVIILNRNGNIINSYELDGPMNSILVIGEDESNAIEVISKIEGMFNPLVFPDRPLLVERKISNEYNSFIYGITIAPIHAALPLPSNEPIVLSCIMQDGFVHQIKLDRTTGYLIEDTIVDNRNNNDEIAVLGNSLETDIAILDKYYELGCPPLTVYGGNGEGGGTTIGGYGKNSGGEYYYYFLDVNGLLYRCSIIKNDNSDGTSEYSCTNVVVNRDCVYLHPDMQESDDYAQLNRVTLADTAMTAINRVIPAPITCYKGEAIGVGSAQMVTITPLRVKILLRKENDVINYYTECTILGDNLNTIEVWEVSHTTGVATLISTTPFAEILGLSTNA